MNTCVQDIWPHISRCQADLSVAANGTCRRLIVIASNQKVAQQHLQGRVGMHGCSCERNVADYWLRMMLLLMMAMVVMMISYIVM